MRHVGFILGLFVALVATLPMAFPFAMNECTLAGGQPEIDLCFARNDLAMKVYFGTALIVALIAVVSHLGRKPWTWLALCAIPVAPIAVLFIGL
ncbi:hypothetical protein COO09_19830 [Rhizorhabdus dicambivorans]|uniref:Uncharacterized protein n=1 Tax=Rhizorhabdus dicambivorans TaxID=1850238 RepID=A0A2A4FQY7_9SPHN|nr:hypothetical protein CMV14_07640 [Rhizorhabdus dicambivorans]PCE40577.1 hypothetical protein COO09_19830 [Rhizorhabdus dicambivorans]